LGRLTAALADRYRIERELGAGGMATVYLAEDLKHHRKVAVKVLRADLAASLGPERFLREVTIAANLQHPHVLPLYDSGQADGFLYYVMPYVEGISLRQKLIREGELPIPDAVRILRDVADALAYAHRHGVVHRDIKPENVMLSDRHALVTDFGVAKAVSEATGRQTLTTAGVALGTPAYMAPEQAAADPHTDHRADIYAFGVVAYELLTGRPPFTGASPQAVLAAHVTTAADPVTKFRASIPPSLAALVMRCLEKKPADRWQSADELIPALEAVLTPSGGMTPTFTQPVTSLRSPVRRLMPLVVGVAALLAVALVVGYLVWRPGAGGRTKEGDRAAVMVLPFETRVERAEWREAGRQVAELMETAIGRAGIGRVIPRPPGTEGAVTPELARKLLRETGAGTLVTGTVREVGDSLEVQARLVRSSDLKLWFMLGAERGGTGPTAPMFGRAKERVLAALAMYLDPLWIPADMTIYGPARTLAAYRAYAEGFRKGFEAGDIDAEMVLLIEASRQDTGYVSPALLRASLMFDGGRLREMDSLDQWVAQRRDRLAPGDAAQLQWSLARHSGSPEEEYRAALAGFRLDSIGWAYTVLLSAATAGRAEDVLRHARRRPDSTTFLGRNWSPWYGLEIGALHVLGRYDEALRLVRLARVRQPENPSHLADEASQLAAMGRIAEADSLVTAAYGYAWPLAPAQVLANIAGELRAHGKPAEGSIRVRRLLDFMAGLPATLSPEDARVIRVARPHFLYEAGQYEEARRLYGELRRTDPGTDASLEGVALDGLIAGRLGDTASVRRVVTQLLADSTPGAQGSRRYWAARTLGAAGRCEEAVTLLKDALNRGARLSYADHVTPDWGPIRSCRAFQETIRPK